MSVYKRGAGYQAEITINRKGHAPYRDTRTFSTKAEAQAWEADQRARNVAAIKAGRTIPPPDTLSQALTRFWNEASELAKRNAASGIVRDKVKLNPSLIFIKKNTSKVNAWQAHPLSAIRLRDVTLTHLENFIESRRDDDKAEATIRHDLNVIRYLLEWAKEKWKWEIDNVARTALQQVGQSNTRDRRPSTDENARLLAIFREMRTQQLPRQHETGPLWRERVEIRAAGIVMPVHPHNSRLYMAAAYQAAIECAMRRSVLFQACWSWIDWDQEFLMVPVEHQGPSNKRVPRAIPISPLLMGILRELHKARATDAAHEKIFGELTGDQAHQIFKDTCNALAIEDLRWHDLRHEACSRLAERGWTIQEIQAVSGHKTLQALQRYMHIRPAAIRDKMKREAAAQKPAPAAPARRKSVFAKARRVQDNNTPTPPASAPIPRKAPPPKEIRRGHLRLVA